MRPFQHFLPALLLAHACCSLVACAGTVPAPPPAPLVNVALTLAMGKSATLRPGLSLSFDRVNDSRCPQGVQCVWAGELVYRLTLHAKVDQPFALGDKTPDFTSVTGLTVHLANDKPPPLPVANQPPPAYAVMLLINSN